MPSTTVSVPPATGIPVDEALRLIRATGADLERAIERANLARDHFKGDEVRLCAITNAKSGHCPEDCGFCSQSSKYQTDAPEYRLRSAEELSHDAIRAWEAGAGEFSIVASGRAMTKERELAEVEAALRTIREKTTLLRCASLGLQDRASLERLKAAGLQAVHHNLETARSHHPNIVTTHNYDDEVEAIRTARAVGLHVCSGGIFGMGETPEQRVEMLEALRELDVDSVPLNFLNPRPGTPVAEKYNITLEECLAVIVVARLMMPAKEIFVCGGREVNLGQRLDEIFRAGANGTMVGNYLTTMGRGVEKDLQAIGRQGLRPVGITESATAPAKTRRLAAGDPRPGRSTARLPVLG
ncbi:MAG: biotin synthase BioB [Deltaproteobacteria bacterium]|nr:biotin synthase BioB [Deltaproteobacteria bacterium]